MEDEIIVRKHESPDDNFKRVEALSTIRKISTTDIHVYKIANTIEHAKKQGKYMIEYGCPNQRIQRNLFARLTKLSNGSHKYTLRNEISESLLNLYFIVVEWRM